MVIIKKMRCGARFDRIYFSISPQYKNILSSVVSGGGDGCCDSCAASTLSKVIVFDTKRSLTTKPEYIRKVFDAVGS